MKKDKDEDRIVFRPGTKTGMEPEVVFVRVTPPRNNKEKGNVTYVLMSTKLPATKKAIENLQ